MRMLPLAAVAGGSLALAAVSLLLPSTPTYDPWAWAVWGREIAGLELETSAGPAFKPLPVLAGAVLSPLGDAAPWVWLVVARAGALLSVAMAWRLARRLSGGSLLAGAVAAAGVALAGGWVWNGALGNAEGVMLALGLVALDRALDGHPRQALALGFAAALVRTEAVPFVVVYGLWLWRAERAAPGGPRRSTRRLPATPALLGAGIALLPVLWLGPDLLGSGDALRSSERARVPNPGAPALAERPALESLARALALAPTIVWAGALLALAGARRRELPRAAALPALAGLAWIGLVAAMSELGYSGEERYALAGAALVAVSAGCGVGWAVRRAIAGGEVTSGTIRAASDFTPREEPGRVAGRRRAGLVAAALLLLAAAVAQSLPRLLDDARSLGYEAALYGRLDDAVAAAGGREAVNRCGPVHTAPYSRPAMAWRLRVPIGALSTETARGGIAFRARPHRGAARGPALAGGGWRPIGGAGEWTVMTRC
jgi:hypothetical protein